MKMQMNAKALYIMLISLLVIICASFIALGIGVNKLLGTQAEKLSTQRAVSEALNSQQLTLTKNKQDLIKYEDLNAIAKSVVPQDKDQAEAVREIVNIANQSGIPGITSITFPASTLGTVNKTPIKGKGNLTQLTPVKGISGVYDLQITVTQDATGGTTYDQFLTFLRNLEQNRRTAQVSSISVTPNQENLNTVGFTLIIDEYIKP
jgi:Ca2+-binding EF-hand superfamily protein